MSKETEAPLLLKVEQAADILNCSRSLAWRLIWSGKLPHVKLGRVVRVPRKALEAWIDQNQAHQPTFAAAGQPYTPENCASGQPPAVDREAGGEQRAIRLPSRRR